MSNYNEDQIQNLYKYGSKGFRNFKGFFVLSLLIKYLVSMCKISRLKNKIPQKYPLTLKQVFATDLSVRLGRVRCSLDNSFLKHLKSRLLSITTWCLRDTGNLCHGCSLFGIGPYRL
jgi:hypothetical protein